MRTESDLRAAFGSLAGNAPDLAGTRAGITRAAAARRRTRWRAGGGLAVAAVAAAAAIVLTAGSAPPPTSHSALRAKLLAAIDSTADEILAEQYTEPPSMGGATVHSWYGPVGGADRPAGAQPVAHPARREAVPGHGDPLRPARAEHDDSGGGGQR